MYRFAYHRAGSLEDAVRLAGSASEGRFLAGGMTLLAALKHRLDMPSDLIDVNGLDELRGIRADGETLVVGAGTSHAEVATSSVVAETLPALGGLAGRIGDPAVRNRGTLGGSIANADPAADYPAAVVALDADIVTHRRTLGADDFFTGFFETALAPGEIILRLAFRRPRRAAYAKAPHLASRYALAGVFVADFGDRVRVAVTGAGPFATRHRELETALAKEFSAASARSVPINPEGWSDDMHGSAAYRANLVSVLAARATAAAA